MKLYRDMTAKERVASDHEMAGFMDVIKNVAEMTMAEYDRLPRHLRDLFKEDL